MAFGEMADPAAFDAASAVNMELKPGEFFIFSERTLHRSSKKPLTNGASACPSA